MLRQFMAAKSEAVKRSVALCLTVMLATPLAWAQGSVDENPNAFAMTGDLLVARPIGAAMTVVAVMLDPPREGLVFPRLPGTSPLSAAEAKRLHLDPMVAEFTEISQKEGLTAALSWRDERFGDYRTKK